MCTRALLASVKRPVDSMTSSTPRSFHGSSAGSLWLRNFTERPSTLMASSVEDTAGPHVATAGTGQLLQQGQAVVTLGVEKVHPPRQLAQVKLRMLAPPAGHLAQRRRKPLQTTAALEPFDRGRLAETGSDRLADVGRLEVEPAIHLTAHFAHHPHALELHDRAARPHQGKQAPDRATFFAAGGMLAGRPT